MNLYSVDSDEARSVKRSIASNFQKRWTLHRYVFLEALNASSLRFFLSIKHFIAVTFEENHRFTLHRRYFLKRFSAEHFTTINFSSNFAHLCVLISVKNPWLGLVTTDTFRTLLLPLKFLGTLHQTHSNSVIIRCIPNYISCVPSYSNSSNSKGEKV